MRSCRIVEHGQIVDIGSPAELVRRHSPERTVILVTDSPGAEEQLRSLSSLQAVARHDAHRTFQGRGTSL